MEVALNQFLLCYFCDILRNVFCIVISIYLFSLIYKACFYVCVLWCAPVVVQDLPDTREVVFVWLQNLCHARSTWHSFVPFSPPSKKFTKMTFQLHNITIRCTLLPPFFYISKRKRCLYIRNAVACMLQQNLLHSTIGSLDQDSAVSDVEMWNAW